MGYEKDAYLYLLFHYTETTDSHESTPKIKMLMFGLNSHFGLWDTIPLPPPESQHTYHIYYIKFENALTCKLISLDLRGLCFKSIFLFSYMYNTKSDHFSPKIKMYIKGNSKSNAKSLTEANSELINGDRSIYYTLILMKSIGRDTL